MVQEFYHQPFLRLYLRPILAIGLMFVVASMLIDIRPIVFLILFCILNAGFLTYERYVDLPVDFEFSTFATVLMTVKYGLAWGLIAAVATKLAAVLYNRDFNMNSLLTMLSYIVAALATSLLLWLHMDIVTLGIAVAALVAVYNFLAFKMSNLMSMQLVFMYGISNLIFNFIVFLGFSTYIFRLMF